MRGGVGCFSTASAFADRAESAGIFLGGVIWISVGALQEG